MRYLPFLLLFLACGGDNPVATEQLPLGNMVDIKYTFRAVAPYKIFYTGSEQKEEIYYEDGSIRIKEVIRHVSIPRSNPAFQNGFVVEIDKGKGDMALKMEIISSNFQFHFESELIKEDSQQLRRIVTVPLRQ